MRDQRPLRAHRIARVLSQGGEKARFDQQPIEAAGAVSACLQAYRVTGDNRWRSEAWSAFNWFLGDNDLQLPLYDSVTGGCRDGLHPDRANENQGAESTLSFLMALLEMRSLPSSPESPPKTGLPSRRMTSTPRNDLMSVPQALATSHCFFVIPPTRS